MVERSKRTGEHSKSGPGSIAVNQHEIMRTKEGGSLPGFFQEYWIFSCQEPLIPGVRLRREEAYENEYQDKTAPGTFRDIKGKTFGFSKEKRRTNYGKEEEDGINGREVTTEHPGVIWGDIRKKKIGKSG